MKKLFLSLFVFVPFSMLVAAGAITLDNSWYHDWTYANPRTYVNETLCVLQGTIRNQDTVTGRFGWMQDRCTPLDGQAINFSAPNFDDRERHPIRIKPNGAIKVTNSPFTNGTDALTLAGIAYVVDEGTRITGFGAGWKHWNRGQQKANFTLRKGICHLSGSLSFTPGGHDNVIATLPTECRPKKTVILPLGENKQRVPYSLYVYPDGDMIMSGSYSSGGEIMFNLAGAHFTTWQGKPLTLGYGWENRGGIYKEAVYVKNRYCKLDGLVKRDLGIDNGVIAVLPEDCRPTKKMIFVLPSQGAGFGVKVNIGTNGWIGPQDWDSSQTDYVSLSPIYFLRQQ